MHENANTGNGHGSIRVLREDGTVSGTVFSTVSAHRLTSKRSPLLYEAIYPHDCRSVAPFLHNHHSLSMTVVEGLSL